MIPYVRLAYASTATARPADFRHELRQALEPDWPYIFNQQLNGVLLYGNGYFFQCIEGKKNQVDRFYQSVLQDSHHQHIDLLLYEPIAQVSLVQRGLCYMYVDAPITRFFRQNQHSVFNPYLLDQLLIHPFLDVLYHNAYHHPLVPNQALMTLEASQSSYMMSFKDMMVVAGLSLFMLIPLYLIITVLPGTSGFFLF